MNFMGLEPQPVKDLILNQRVYQFRQKFEETSLLNIFYVFLKQKVFKSPKGLIIKKRKNRKSRNSSNNNKRIFNWFTTYTQRIIALAKKSKTKIFVKV